MVSIIPEGVSVGHVHVFVTGLVLHSSRYEVSAIIKYRYSNNSIALPV